MLYFVFSFNFQCSSGAHRFPKIQFSLSFLYISLISNYFVVWDGSGSEFPSSGLAQKNRISFNASRRLGKINFFGAGGPPSVIRCQTTQLAPSVNVPRIRRHLVARFGSKPFLDEIHSILSFCVGRMSISMGKWEALDGFPNQEHRSTSGDEYIVRHSS